MANQPDNNSGIRPPIIHSSIAYDHYSHFNNHQYHQLAQLQLLMPHQSHPSTFAPVANMNMNMNQGPYHQPVACQPPFPFGHYQSCLQSDTTYSNNGTGTSVTGLTDPNSSSLGQSQVFNGNMLRNLQLADENLKGSQSVEDCSAQPKFSKLFFDIFISYYHISTLFLRVLGHHFIFCCRALSE
jgi:hypothetical protein